jgi:hypothetical protein
MHEDAAVPMDDAVAQEALDPTLDDGDADVLGDAAGQRT